MKWQDGSFGEIVFDQVFDDFFSTFSRAQKYQVTVLAKFCHEWGYGDNTTQSPQPVWKNLVQKNRVLKL